MIEKLKAWREDVEAWWTGRRRTNDAQRNEVSCRLARELSEALGTPYDPGQADEAFYSSTGQQGAKYRLPKQLKKLAVHPMVCAIAGVAAAAWLADSFR